MKIVQNVGGSATNQDAYTGPERELTVDTDNWDLRLHDGVTVGGHRILSRDNADSRYQLRSAELDGFNFKAEQRGFLVRQTTGQFKIRIFQWDANAFDVVNPDGYNGNPSLTLNLNIIGDRIFTGDVEITGVLQVDGGINADISGNLTGNVVGNLIGDVVGNLTGNAAGNHSGSFTGDVDVRGNILQLDDGQIPTSKIAGLSDYIKQEALPSGVILIWSGSAASIPAGWYLCNGLNGTPDLTDKFIVGAGSLTYDPGDTGGASTHTHANSMDPAGGHTHVITVDGHVLVEAEIPSHTHNSGVTDSPTNPVFNHGSVTAVPTTSHSIDGNSATGSLEGITSPTGGGGAHDHTASADTLANHTHTLNNVAASSLPPYYALCFIMRVIV